MFVLFIWEIRVNYTGNKMERRKVWMGGEGTEGGRVAVKATTKEEEGCGSGIRNEGTRN